MGSLARLSTRPQESMGLLKWTLINEAKKKTKLIHRQPYNQQTDDQQYLTTFEKWHARIWCIDHVVQCHASHNLAKDVLHLCVSIIDRMLEEDDLFPSDYTLMVDTALYIAFRFTGNAPLHKRYKPTNLFYCLDDVYAMESHILACVDFEISPPTHLPVKYYYQLVDIVYLNPMELNFGLFFMELCYCERSLSDYPPLVYGAAILYITLRLTRRRHVWGSFMIKITGLDTEDLCPVVQELAETILRAVRDYNFAPSIKEKYANILNMSVSVLPHLKSDVLPKLAKIS